MRSLHQCFKTTYDSAECLASTDEIRQILSNHPHSIAEVRACDGRLPLHTALDTLGNTPFEIIKLLVDAYPGAARKKDDDGGLPIHHACDNGADIKTLELLLDQYPESIHVEAPDGFTPLHFACYPSDFVDETRKMQMIRFLLKRQYSSASTNTTSSMPRFDVDLIRPLACHDEDCVDILETFVLYAEGIPDHLRHPDFLAHALCYINSASRVLLFCFENNRNGALLDVNDHQQGNTVLHTFLKNAKFTKSYPSGRPDEDAMLYILQRLCRMRPNWLLQENKYGDLPLHVACGRVDQQHPAAFLRALLDACPCTVDRSNRRGQLPIHIVAENGGGGLEVVRLLVTLTSQDVLGIADPTTRLVPFLAAATSNSLDVISTLLREDPAQLLHLQRT
jgi:ankyrin repeat protein